MTLFWKRKNKKNTKDDFLQRNSKKNVVRISNRLLIVSKDPDPKLAEISSFIDIDLAVPTATRQLKNCFTNLDTHISFQKCK